MKKGARYRAPFLLTGTRGPYGQPSSPITNYR
jgi:hypothetical protein